MNKLLIGAAVAALGMSSAAFAEPQLPQSSQPVVPVSAGAEQVAAQAAGLGAGFTSGGLVMSTIIVAGIVATTVQTVDSGQSSSGTPGT